MSKNTPKGIAIIECTQEIPCNPCVSVCKCGAITKENLNACPVLHTDKCIGCKLCVAECPGQAIFLQVPDYDETSATITFPFEYRPLPIKGQTVQATDRFGQVMCEAEVLLVENRNAFNKTPLVTLKIPKEQKDTVRFMKRLAKEEANHES